MTAKIIKPIDNPQHISILFPTRGRSHYLQALFDSIAKTTTVQSLIDVWIFIDDDDFVAKQALDEHIAADNYDFKIHYVFAPRTYAQGQMYNILRERCTTNPGIYMFVADKVLFVTPDWDVVVRETFDRYPDRILYAYINLDPSNPNIGYYGCVSAEWANITGRLHTEFFPFWYDDTWINEVAIMGQSHTKLDIQLEYQGSFGVNKRLRNLHFWFRFYKNTAEERMQEAELILDTVFAENPKALAESKELMITSAEMQMQLWNTLTDESLSLIEQTVQQASLNEIAVTQIPAQQEFQSETVNPATAIPKSTPFSDLYFVAERQAIAHLKQKAERFIEQNRFSEAVALLDNILFASQVPAGIHNLRAQCLREMGDLWEAEQAILKELEQTPQDRESQELLDRIQQERLQALKLRDINLLIFPDWQQEEEARSQDVIQVISALVRHPQSDRITLLIETTGIEQEDAEQFILGVMMLLALQEGQEDTDLEISLTGNLSPTIWEVILGRVAGRIVLPQENRAAIKAVAMEAIKTVSLDQLLFCPAFDST
ncbi:tetratricopeptide repeat protein [Tumidithrix elongata RA019]|uniref:Tetratricopeptide repeat protein n=1 Tax=Tumidithrix elongata BACA0141 TaxID=2716417 RepID=A0AAW9PQU3_9CYAN|nr:tetratricopeptide repeat protein [Tumidithrix elongata RA019]